MNDLRTIMRDAALALAIVIAYAAPATALTMAVWLLVSPWLVFPTIFLCAFVGVVALAWLTNR